MTLSAGAKLGPYEVIALLGSGGMGEVYRAVDGRLGRAVAVKVLPAIGATDPAAIERFRREARTASSLSHPQICAVYDVGESEGRLFLVMELLQGQSLQEELKAGPLSVARAVDIAIAVAEGLEAAHEKGIVHRDVKPANLFVTTRGHIKVLDFGVAKLVQATSDAQTVGGLTTIGEALGTVAYMSPEQARGETVDARTDLFSLGLVLYEMLAGKPALTGATAALLFDALLNRSPASLRQMDRDVPQAVDAVVTRLLAKSPADRYQTATALLADLTEARRGGAASPSSRSRRPRETAASVAVLPFTSSNPDAENEYLADGITEEVISALGRLPTLQVPGRVSCFAFKGKPIEIADVASKLHVANVLTGTVRRSGTRLRITAELVSAHDGFQLWSERFDRTADDVFAIQDEIATSIAHRLQATLGNAPLEPLVRRATENLDAYALYLKGRFFLNQRGQAIRKGLEAFKQAIDLDPDFAPAQAGLAEAYSLEGFYGYSPGRQVMPMARAAAARAVALDARLAEPHVALQIACLVHDWDWTGTRAEFERGITKNPNAAGAWTMRAVELATVHGRFDEAFAAARCAIEIDPLSPFAHYALGMTLMCAHSYSDAVVAVDRALELHPGMWTASRVKGIVLSLQGEHGQAITWLEQAVRMSDRHPWVVANMIEALELAGRSPEAVAWSKNMFTDARERHVQPSVLALAAAVIDGMDAAFDWLERAYEEHDLLPLLNYYPSALRLKRDPRWALLMRRIGLEPGVE
jgi:serine/threonine protein kinase/Flp pilus assembly protein TadD